MTIQARHLAEHFDRINQDVIVVVETATAAGWARTCPDQECTVAALATHIAEGHAGILEVVRSMLVDVPTDPTPPEPFRPEDLDQLNAERARVNAQRPQSEVLALLRADGSLASTTIRELTTVELTRTAVLPFGGEPVTVQAFIEQALIGHPHAHLDTLRTVLSSSA